MPFSSKACPRLTPSSGLLISPLSISHDTNSLRTQDKEAYDELRFLKLITCSLFWFSNCLHRCYRPPHYAVLEFHISHLADMKCGRHYATMFFFCFFFFWIFLLIKLAFLKVDLFSFIFLFQGKQTLLTWNELINTTFSTFKIKILCQSNNLYLQCIKAM